MYLQSIPIPSLRLKISDDDTTPDFLISKLLAGSGVSLTVGNDGANETLTVANTDPGSAAVSAHLSAFNHAPLSQAASASANGYLSSTDWSTFDGKLTLPALTSGSVLFSDGATIAQDNTGLFWEQVNRRLGVGLINPTRRIESFDSANPQIRLTHTAGSVYGEIQARSTGVTAFTTTGNAFTMTGATLALGKSVETATKNRQTQYLLDGTDPVLVRQTEYWDGAAFATDGGFGFGRSALYQNTGAYSNGFGDVALYQNTGAYSNGFGYGALYQNTGTSSNGFGHVALYQNTGAYSNGFGRNAVSQNTGAYSNGFGYSALSQNTGAYSNGFGHASLSRNNWANAIAIGNQSTTYFQENAASTKTFTEAAINATAKTITISSHGFGSSGKINLKFKLVSGTAPGGLTNNAIYQFTLNDADTLYYSWITSVGSGTFSLTNSVNITNTIVIGNETNATKANQVVLGNASIVETRLNGNVGVGVSPTSAMDVNGDIETLSTGAFYFGDPTTDGTWRIKRNGNNLLFERRESGAYVTKSTISA